MNGKNVTHICIHVSLAEIILSVKLYCFKAGYSFITFEPITLDKEGQASRYSVPGKVVEGRLLLRSARK